MTHRTFRSLDAAAKLLGFSLRQWACLIAGASALLAIVYLARLPAKPAITLFVFAIGLPAALTYVSESGGLQLGVLLRDIWRWRVSARRLPAASPRSGHPPGLLVAAAGPSPEAGGRAETAVEEHADFWERWW